MNVFNNVSTQVSGLGSSIGSWFKKEGKEGEDGPSEEAKPANNAAPDEQSGASVTVSEQPVKGSGDDEAASQHSGATESADSNPPSEPEEDAASKAGFASGLTFNLSGVSSRASASAKSVGSFFSSAFSKAGASVKEAGSKIKESVERNTLLSEFNKEQDAFIQAKGGKSGEALPPWVGYPQEESIKEEVLSLSTDRRNFVRSPPTGVTFEFELEQFLPVAQATLTADPNLEKMRFELVPKVVSEENFWRNYFYRVGLIRQNTELSSLEKEGKEPDASQQSNPDANKGIKGGTDEDASSPQDMESEFVSDSLQPSSKDIEEVKKGISELTKNSGDAEWEAELREELGEDLGDYEVVTSKDNDQWEEEIQNMIDEDDGDLR